MSNVVYKFSCLRDASTSYIGMTTRHLGQGHSKNSKSAIRDHIELCRICQDKHLGINNFEVIRTCKSEYETKIQETLLIKKYNPQLNKQLYVKRASFLLNVY